MNTYLITLNTFSSIVAISGKDFAIVASDTRLSEGYMIYTRKQSKLFQLSDKSVLGCTGCWCDTLSLTNIIQSQLKVKNIITFYYKIFILKFNTFSVIFVRSQHNNAA